MKQVQAYSTMDPTAVGTPASGNAAPTVKMIDTRTGKTHTYVLTAYQESAAQAMANGEAVQMARKSGKSVIRQRVLDILADRAREAGGDAVTATSNVTAVETKTKTEYVWVVTDVIELKVLGVRKTKTAAKALAVEDNGSDITWVNERKFSSGADYRVEEFLLPKTDINPDN